MATKTTSKTQDGYPEWAQTDPGWAALLHIADHSTLVGQQIHTYINWQTRRIDLKAVLAEARAWSSGEQLLLRIALDCLDPWVLAELREKPATIASATRLDAADLRVVMQAMWKMKR